jgi:hypothetical protein
MLYPTRIIFVMASETKQDVIYQIIKMRDSTVHQLIRISCHIFSRQHFLFLWILFTLLTTINSFFTFEPETSS